MTMLTRVFRGDYPPLYPKPEGPWLSDTPEELCLHPMSTVNQAEDTSRPLLGDLGYRAWGGGAAPTCRG